MKQCLCVLAMLVLVPTTLACTKVIYPPQIQQLIDDGSITVSADGKSYSCDTKKLSDQACVNTWYQIRKLYQKKGHHHEG